MGTVTLAARTLLAVVFGVAALAKLSSRSESPAMFREFGAGDRLSRVGAVLLAPAELVVAITLMIVPTARWAALGAIVLLIIFIVGIVNALTLGRRPDCGCFGALRPTPIGAPTVVRNGVLLGVAALVAATGPGPAADRWLASRDAAALVALAVVIAALAAALVYALRSGAARVIASPMPPRALPILQVGDPAPDFSLRDESGRIRTLGSLAATGNPMVLVFASSGCGSCLEVLAHIDRWQAIFGSHLRIAVVGVGDAEETRRVFDRYGAHDVLTGAGHDLQSAYGVLATPAAVAVAPDRTVANGPVIGKDAIEDLVRLTLRHFDPMYDPWSQTTNVA